MGNNLNQYVGALRVGLDSNFQQATPYDEDSPLDLSNRSECYNVLSYVDCYDTNELVVVATFWNRSAAIKFAQSFSVFATHSPIPPIPPIKPPDENTPVDPAVAEDVESNGPQYMTVANTIVDWPITDDENLLKDLEKIEPRATMGDRIAVVTSLLYI